MFSSFFIFFRSFAIPKDIIGEWEIYEQYNRENSKYAIEFHNSKNVLSGSLWSNEDLNGKKAHLPDEYVISFFSVRFATKNSGSVKLQKQQKIKFEFVPANNTLDLFLENSKLETICHHHVEFIDNQNGKIVEDKAGEKRVLILVKSNIKTDVNLSIIFNILCVIMIIVSVLITIKNCIKLRRNVKNHDEKAAKHMD